MRAASSQDILGAMGQYLAAGAFHSAELWYVFGTLERSWRPFTAADRALSARMLDAWTAFCKNGNPGWPAYKASEPYKELFDIE